MNLLTKALPYLEKAKRFFTTGIKVAKAAAYVCMIGAIATGRIIAEVLGIIEEDELDTEDDAIVPTLR